jgi:hypothetical protein
MPKIALADTLREWESLLAAAAEKGTGVPALGRPLEELQATLERTRALADLRVKLQASLQKATQDLEASREEGRQLTIRVRSLLKAAFGLNWEGLVQFGVRPRRKRRRPSIANRSTQLAPLVDPGADRAPDPRDV